MSYQHRLFSVISLLVVISMLASPIAALAAPMSGRFASEASAPAAADAPAPAASELAAPQPAAPAAQLQAGVPPQNPPTVNPLVRVRQYTWCCSSTNIRYETNYILGYFPTGTPATVRLFDENGTWLEDANITSNIWWSSDINYQANFSTAIEDGYTIQVTGGGVTQVVYVNDLTDSTVNPEDDTVSGVFAGLPNTPLRVAVGAVEKKVTTDGSGNFTADFSGMVDIDWNDVATIYTTNADGNQVYYERGAKVIRVRWNALSFDGDNIHGYWPVDATLDFEVEHAGWVESKSESVSAGSDFSIDFDPITDTATITVTDGVITDVIDVAAATDVTLDSYAESVGATLTGVANTPVTVYWEGALRETSTNGSGAFTANFEGDGDVAVGDTVNSGDDSYFYYTEDAHQVYYSNLGRAYGVRTRWANGYNAYYVAGYLPTLNVPVTVTKQSPAYVNTDAALDGDGRFQVYMGGNPITDTNTITATDGATTRTVDTPRITAIGDYVNDTVSGTGPAGARLWVKVTNVWPYPEEDALVQPDGTWSVTLPVNLGTGSNGWVRYTEPDGDEVYYYWHADYKWISLYDWGNDLNGYFPIPNHPISITLWSGTTYKDGVAYTTNNSGHYNLDFGPQVEEGDTIRVTDGAITQTYDIPAAFNGVGDANTDTVSGQVSAATDITDTTGNVYPNLYVQLGAGDYVTTDVAGNFEFYKGSLTRGNDGYIRYIDAEGTEFYRNITVPGISYSQAGSTWLEGYYPKSGVPVTATLYSVTDTFKSAFAATAQGWSNWFNGSFTQSVQMGDLIEVEDTEDGVQLSLRVPTVTVHSNQATDMVNGVIETSAGGVEVDNTDWGMYPLLWIRTNTASGWEDEYITSTTGGAFIFDPGADIQPGDRGYVEYTDPEGDYVRYPDFYAHGIRVQDGGTASFGEGFLPNTTITVTQSDDPGQQANATTNDNGYYSGYYYNDFTNTFDPGDTITVTDGANTYVVTVPDLQIRAYAGSDKVFGTGLNSKLEVTLSGDSTYREVTDLGGGAWMLDLSGEDDFDIGERVYYRYTDNNHNQVYHIGNNYPVGETDTAQVRWYGSGYDADRLRGYFPGWTAGNITATLHAADGSYRGQQVDTGIGTGGFYDVSFGVTEIQDGDFITVTDGVDIIRIDVPVYTVDGLDYAVDRITGTLAYTDGVNPVQASGVVTDLLRAINTNYSSNWYYSAFFNADANGVYALDMSTTPRGIHPSDDVRYLYVDAAGNEVYFNTQNLDTTASMTTSGEVRWTGSSYDSGVIRGYWASDPPGGIDIYLYDVSDGVIRTEWDSTGTDGWFYESSVGSWPEYIENGDIITLTDGVDTVVIPIADVQVEADADADTVTVIGLPANKAAQVQIEKGSDVTVTNVTADGAGQAVVDFGALNTDIEDGDSGYVVYDPHGFAIYTPFNVTVYEAPQVDVYAYDTYLEFNPQTSGVNMPYTLTLRTGSNIKDTQYGTIASWWNWTWWNWSHNFAETIEPGDTVDVTVLYPDGVERSTSVYVDPAFAVEAIDFHADTVTVSAPAGITGTTGSEYPYLWVGFGWGQYVTSTTGTYVADDLGDLGRNAGGEVWHANSEGNRVRIWANNPIYRVYQHSDGYDVTGHTLLPRTAVQATLYDEADQMRAQASVESDGAGWFGIDFEDAYGYDLQIEPGDTVELDIAGEGVTTIEIPTLTGMADFALDTISGVITGTAVTFPITGTNNDHAPSLLVHSQYVTPTVGSGAYLAENLGLTAGDEGEVRYVRPDGHEIYNTWCAPQLQARYNGSGFDANQVRGYIPTIQNVTVTLRLLDSDGAVRDVEYFQDNGWFWHEFDDVYGNDVDIENGDTVEMIVEGHTWAVTVPDPFYAEADYVGDTVFGQIDGAANFTATADITESVYIDGFGIDAVVETDADGAFSADGSDFGATERGYVRYRDTQGFEVYQQAIAPWAMIELGGNRVDGSVVRPNVPVAVTLTDSADAFKDDEQATSNNNGMFAVEFEDNLGNPVLIEDGDQVEIVASPPITVNVPTIEVWADADSDIISGTISVPVGQNLSSVLPNLYIKLDVGSGLYRWITTTASSPYTFEYDFSGIYDVQDGDTGEVRYTNAEGHQIYLNFIAEADAPGPVHDQTELYLRQNNVYDVRGTVAYANAEVTLRLKDAFGNVKGTRTVNADVSGGFATAFKDAAGNDVAIADGDTVYAASAGETMSVTVPTMTGLTADYETDAVSGVITGGVVDHPLLVTPHEVTYTSYLSGTGAFAWTDVTATTGITLTGFTDLDDGYTDTVPLGFDFEFYGQVYTQAVVATNGFLGFGSTSGFDGYQTTPITDGVAPNNFIAPFATDLDLSTVGHVYYTMTGTAPNRIFTVQWDGVEQLNTGLTQTFQALLYEGSNLVKFQYGTMHAPNDVTLVGVENMTGTLGTQYWYTNTGTALGPITDSLAVVFTPTAFTDYYWQEVPALSDQLFVEVHSGGGSEYVTTTLTGAFDTLNGPSYGDPPDDVEAQGIDPLDTGYVQFTNVVPNAGNTDWAQRHHVFYDFAASEMAPTANTPYAVVRQNGSAEIWGLVTWPDEAVALSLYDATGALKSQINTTSNAGGGFNEDFADAAGNDVPIEDGDVVKATSLDTSIVITVPLHTIAYDVLNNAITGTLTGELAAHPITNTGLMTQTLLQMHFNFHELLTTTVGGTFHTMSQTIAAGDTGDLLLYSPVLSASGDIAQQRYIYYPLAVPDAQPDFAFDALRVQGYGTYVVAEANYAGQPVTFALYDDQGALLETRAGSTAWWGDGDYEVWFATAILPGYTVEVVYDADPAIRRAFTVPALAVTEVDTFNEVVTGTASFTESFEVNWNGGISWNNGALSGGTTRDVTPAAGVWTADFFGDQNLQPGYMDGHLLYTDADDNQLYQRYAAQQITVLKDQARVYGPVYNGGVTVTLTLLDSAGNVKDTEVFRANDSGYFSRDFRDIYNNLVYIHAGDRVVIEASYPVTIEAPALSAWADWHEETVVGTSSLHGETINVDLAGCASQSVVVDGSTGFYGANFAGLCNLTAGQTGHVYYANADGNRVRLDFTVPDLHIRYNYDTNRLAGNTAAGTEVTVTAQLADAASGEVKGTAMTTWGVNSHGQYNFQLYDKYGNPTPILPGDTITVTETAGIGVRTQSFTVPEMTANTDLLTDIVSGQMGDQANTAFEINVEGNTDTITTTTGGAYTANFAPVYDIEAGDYVQLNYADTDHGRWFYFENRAPVVDVRWHSGSGNYNAEYVSGYADSNAQVVVTLWRNGALMASRTAWAQWNGFYNVQLLDNANAGVEIKDGDVVQVQTADGSTYVSVVPLDFDPDVAAQTVTGSGVRSSGELEIYFGGVRRTALVDAGGVFTATFPANTFDYSEYGHGRYLNGDQNLVRYQFYIPVAEAFVRVLVDPSTDLAGFNVGGRVPVEYAEVTVTLLDGATVKSVAYATADDQHQFGAALLDSYGNPIEIMPGDTVRLESEGMATVLEVTAPFLDIYGTDGEYIVNGTVGDLTISQTGLITNSVLAARRYGFSMRTGKAFAPGPRWTQAVTTTNGAFSTGFAFISGESLPEGQSLTVLYTDADGNEFYTRGVVAGADAEAQESVVRAWVGDYNVGGLSPFASEAVTITLTAADGTVKSIETTTANSSRVFQRTLTDAAGNPTYIEPGDTVTVEFGDSGETVTLNIEDPFTLSANATDDAIYGDIGALDIAASPFITDSFILNVDAWSIDWDDPRGTIPLNGGDNRAVTVTTGFYTTTWPSNFNASDPVWAIYTNDEGHQQILQVVADEDAPSLTQARVTVYVNENYVDVIHPQSNEPVTATLTRNGVQIATTEGETGSGFKTWEDVYGSDEVYARVADVIQVDFETDEGLQTYTVTVPELSALANYQDDTISGVGPAGEELEVRFNGVERTVYPTPAYQVDYTGLTNIEPGNTGDLYYLITDTAEVQLDVWMDFRAPQATAYLGQTTFDGYTAFSSGPGTPVTATLYRNGEVVGYRAFMSWGSYGYNLCDVYGDCDNDHGNAAAMRPGDELVIAARGEPDIRITLPELAAIADHNADIVTGASNLPDTDIEVHMNGTEQTVRTEADGAFTADFSAPPFANDFGRGTTGHIYYLTPEGHRVYLNVRAPFVRAYLGTNHAYAHVATSFNVTATLTLKDSGGALKAQTSFNTDYDFNVYFRDAFGNPVFIAAGDTLTLDLPNEDPIVLTVPTLTAQPDAAADEVAVTAPAVQSTRRPSATLQLDFQGSRMLTSTTTSYTVWDRDWDIIPGENGTLIYTNENGDEVYLENFVTPIVRVHASSDDVDGNTVSGYAQPNKLIAVALVRDGATLWSGATTSGWDGAFSLNTGPAIETGDVIQVQGGGLNASVDVVEIDATVDYEEETVTGVGPADVTLTDDPLHALWVNSDDDAPINFDNAANRYFDGATQAVSTTAAGAFTADFGDMSGDANSAGDRAELRYTNAAGHQVYAQFEAKQEAPEAKIEIWQGVTTGNVIYGTAGERDAVVWVTLYDSDGATVKATFRTTSDGNGWFDVDDSELQDEYGNPVVIEGGDHVEVKTLDWNTTIEVTPLSAMADVEADTVAGVGPANITDLDGEMTFQVEMDGITRAVTTTATGAFEAVFFDIGLADSGELIYTTPDYVLHRRFYAPGYSLVQIGTANVSGYVTDPGIAVTVEIFRVDTIVGWGTVDANSSGYFSADLRDATGAPAYIQSGDEVSLNTDAGESWSVAVPTLDISADPATDVVTGHAPDGERVRVWAGGSGPYDATAFGGVYEYDFTGRRNVQARDSLQVAYRQDQEDAQVWFFAHGSVPGLSMRLYANSLNASVATGRAMVSYEVRSAAGERRMQDTTLANVYGRLSVNLVDAYGNAVNLLPGDRIVITADEPFTYTVPTLSALADVNADIVSGSAPADTQVRVCIDFGYCQTVWTDGGGDFAANFQGRTNIQAGNTGWLYYHDANGNRYELQFSAPSLNVEYQGDPTDGSRVYGYTSMPYITYTLELERDGTVIARMSGQSGSNGGFSEDLNDLYGNPLLTEAGDVVILYEEGVEVNRTTLHALTALVDIFADTVTGSGPADAQLEVDASYDKTVTTDGSGDFTAANPFYSGGNEAYQNFNAGDTGILRYYHSDGDQIFYNFTAPYLEVHAAFQPGLGSNNSYNAGYVNGSGWPVGRPVVLTLYDSADNVKATLTQLGGSFYNVYFADQYGNRVEIHSSDRIVAQAQGLPALEVTVPALDASVDLEADVVSGTFNGTVADLPVNPSGSTTHTLEVGIHEYVQVCNWWGCWWEWQLNIWRPLTTTVTGAFEHRFGEEPLDIPEGKIIQWNYEDHNANTIHLRDEAPREQLHEPQVNAQLYETRAWGWVLLERVPMTVTLRRAGVALDIWTNLSSDSGYFDVYFRDDTYNNAIYIMPGDQIIVEAEGMDTITLDVPDLTVDPDAAADTVSGTALDDGELMVQLTGYTIEPQVSGGTWLADFRANDYDFNGGDSGALTYTNADGHVVYLNFNVPVVTADLYRSGIYVVNLYPNMPITATLTNGAGNVKAQAETLAAVGYGADLYFLDRFNQPVNILPGDTVTVYPYGADPRVLDIVELDASANPETDQVTGVGPAGETLQVAMGSTLRSVIPAADGSFTFDFTGLYDITAGNTGSLRYYLSAQGDAQELSFAAPVVWVRAGEGSNEGRVHGFADRAGRDVRVEVVRGGNVVATALGSSADYEAGDLIVKDIYDNVVAIQPGDTVNVSFDGGVPIPVDVPGTALDAEIDVDGDTVTVSGPADATVEFSFGDFDSTPNQPRTVILSGGSAIIDYAGYYDIGAGATGYVHWRDANGNSVYVNVADPVINVYEYRTYIAGYIAATDGLARVRLLRGGNEVASGSSDITSNGRIGDYDYPTCPSEFSYRCLKLYDKFGQQMLILPGDTVEVTAPDGAVTTIAVEELWAEVDVVNDTLTVRGPADEEIKVEFSGGFSANTARGLFSSHTIVATGGNQVIEYADPSDPTRDVITSGAYGWLRYYNDEGHRIHRYFRASQVWVYQGQNRVDGDAQHNGADVLVELVRGGSVIASVRTEADNSGNDYRVDFMSDGDPVIIEQGDMVRVTENGGTPIEVEAALSASIDEANDTVTGDAPGPVQVEVEGSQMTVWPEGGVYTADFTGRRDIQGGNTGQLAYLNAAGHTVYLDFAAPRIEAELGRNYVNGYVDRGTNVEVDIELIRGGSRIAAETVIANSSNGSFSAHLVHADGARAIIRPGDTVRVTANGQTREIAVQALTADADEVANTVSGTAPNGEVQLNFNGTNNTVIASGGAYDIEYGAADFRGGERGSVRYQEADGDRVFRSFSTPYIEAEVGGNTVHGDVAYKYITVTVQIERGGGIIAEAEAFVNTHYFSFNMVDAQGAAIALQNGDIVHVHAADAVVAGDGAFSDGSLTIRTLTANVNVAADTVSGSAPNGLVWVEVNDNAQDVVASGGSYSADFSGVYDIGPGNEVSVGYYDAEHDLGYINAYGDQVIVWEGTDRIEGYVPEGGQLVEISVTSGGAEVGVARVWAAWNGYFSARVTRADDENTPYLIQPNDVVQVTNGAWSASVAAVPLTAEIDTAHDQVDVAGPAGAAVNVYVNGYNKLVTLSGGSGAAANPFFNSSRGIYELDLTPGDTGYVRYLDANGHEVRRTFAAPQINARLSNNEVWGYVNGGKQLVTVILADAEGEKGRAYDWTNDYGYFYVQILDDMGHDVIILPEDTVTVQVGGSTVRTMTVAELTAIANPETNIVAGIAPISGDVYVDGNPVEVAPDGTYRYEKWGIWPGSYGNVYYADADGDQTCLSYVGTGLHVREMGKQVFGYVPVANAIVEVQLVAFNREGESVKVRSSSNGYINTQFGSNHIKPGDIIKVVIEGQPDIRIPVPLLEATPYAATDIVTGTGPVNSELRVYHRYHSNLAAQLGSPIQQWPGGEEDRTVRTDANGNFTANFAADNLRADVIEGGEYGYVSYTNEDGHTVYRSYRVPLIRIDITNDTVEMFTEAFTQWRGAHFIGGDAYSGLFERVKADQDGHLITYLWDANENPLDFNAGDEVWLLPEGGDVATELITVTIPASFTVALSPTTNLVYGEAPANAHLRVRAFHWHDSPVLNHARGGWTSRDMIVQANGAGRYSADFSGHLDLVDYDYAYVYYQTEPGIDLVVGTLNHENSPLLGEIEHALAGELHGLESLFVDTANRDEVSTFYYTPTRNSFILGIDWGGSGAFEVTMTGPLGSITETHTFNLNAASAPTMVKMDVPVTGAPWRIDVKATSVANDTFYYNLFTGYYTGIGQIYLPIVAKNH